MEVAECCRVLHSVAECCRVSVSVCLCLSLETDQALTIGGGRTVQVGICRQTLVYRHTESLTHIHSLRFCIVYCLCLCAPNEVSLDPPFSLDPPLALHTLSLFSFARTYAQRLV